MFLRHWRRPPNIRRRWGGLASETSINGDQIHADACMPHALMHDRSVFANRASFYSLGSALTLIPS